MELEDQARVHVLNFCPRRKFLDGDLSQMVGISNRDVDQEVIWTSHVVNGNDFTQAHRVGGELCQFALGV
jgi:hypothetical protein